MAKKPVLVTQMMDVNATLRCVARSTKLGRTVHVRLDLMKIVGRGHQSALSVVHPVAQKDILASVSAHLPRIVLVKEIIEWSCGLYSFCLVGFIF